MEVEDLEKANEITSKIKERERILLNLQETGHVRFYINKLESRFFYEELVELIKKHIEHLEYELDEL